MTRFNRVRSSCTNIVLLAVPAAMVLIQVEAVAQTANSSSSLFRIEGSAEPSTTPVVRDPLGHPCIDAEAAVRAHVVNPDLMDHIVSLKNNCPTRIKAKICYAGSNNCTELTIGSYGRMDTILGTMSGVKSFRYTISHKKL
jgi:hypothetical protein